MTSVKLQYDDLMNPLTQTLNRKTRRNFPIDALEFGFPCNDFSVVIECVRYFLKGQAK
jgi:site-specific DNA-cytosine methylase